MRGVCRLGVASLRRMSRWRDDARRMLEVEWRWEAYVGENSAMGGVCWKWSGDGRRMSKWGADGRRMSKWSGDGRRMQAGGPLARWPGGALAPSDRLRVSARARMAIPTPGAGRGAPGELAGEFSVWALGALEVPFAALFGL